MTGIDHTHEAALHLSDAHDALTDETALYRLRAAQVHATLALTQSGGDELAKAQLVHDTAAGSIGKADAKAGFVASLNTAVLAGVVALVKLDQLGTAARVLLLLGVALMVVAVLFAVAVALPILRARHTKRTNPGDFLYFGAVRNCTPDALADRLKSEDMTEGLCAQAITLSRLSWNKHRMLQVSMLATISGATIAALTLLLTGGAR